MKRFLLGISSFALLSAAFAIAENPRAFITDSKSWEVSGGAGGSSDAFGGGTRGGARPQTAEIIKTFGERCPNVTVNNRQEKADYIVVLDHEGGKGWIRRDNKVAVFNSDGDAVMSHSTRSLGNSVDDACKVIAKDWEANGSKPRAKAQTSATGAPPAAAPVAATAPEVQGRIQISSQPVGADIEVDGGFVGNTPSTINLPPGEHVVAVKKSGYKDWEKKIRISGGEVNLSPELEKLQQ